MYLNRNLPLYMCGLILFAVVHGIHIAVTSFQFACFISQFLAGRRIFSLLCKSSGCGELGQFQLLNGAARINIQAKLIGCISNIALILRRTGLRVVRKASLSRLKSKACLTDVIRAVSNLQYEAWCKKNNRTAPNALL